jgi:two-component system OmpR family sensor kinase
MLHSIRARLTAWYAVVLAIVVIAFGAVSYAMLRRQVGINTDESLASTARELAAALSNESSETSAALREKGSGSALLDFRYSNEPIIIFGDGGREVAWSHSSRRPEVDRRAVQRLVATRRAGFTTLRGRRSFRLLIVPVRILGRPHMVAVMRSLDEQERTLRAMRGSMLFAIPLAVLIAAGGGYLLARKSLQPVAAMSDKAHAISAANLSERIEVSNPRDELGRLATTLNGLLARLQESFESQRRFMEDASHELRTPVAILQGEIDVSLSREDRDAQAYRRSLQVMHRSVRKLTRIVRDLFLLARTDAGQYPLQRQRFYLDETLSGTVENFRTFAADRQIVLRSDYPADILMSGDEDLVQRLVANLLDNAIKYTPSGGAVTMWGCVTANEIRLEVRDTGTAITPESRDRVFGRFFRGDAPSSQPGAGLGLPIARWIAEAHGGRIWIEDGKPEGNTFVVVLPCAIEQRPAFT